MRTTMNQIQDFYSVITGRRSVRHYDPAIKITEQELKEMLTEATLAPSANNIQPWRFIVFNNQAMKEKLLPIAYNQQQVVDASAVIAVLGDLEGYLKVEDIYTRAVQAGYMSEDSKNTLIENITAGYSNLDAASRKNNVLVDGGLVAMQFMLAAKARGYDTVPMSGYKTGQFIKAFNIPERYVPVMLIAVGKAVKEGHPTVRLPIEDVIFWNGMD